MKVVVKIEMEIAVAAEAMLNTKTKLHAHALHLATNALGDVPAGEEPKGVLRDAQGAPCGSWEVLDGPEA